MRDRLTIILEKESWYTRHNSLTQAFEPYPYELWFNQQLTPVLDNDKMKYLQFITCNGIVSESSIDRDSPGFLDLPEQEERALFRV